MQLHQIMSLVAGFTVMLVQGSLYVYGTMTPYLITFLKNRGSENLDISDLSIILTLAVIFTNMGIFVSNFKILTFSNKVTSLISCLGISLSMLVLSFLDQFAFYILIYGCIYGFFIGYGYMAPLKNCYDHLPQRKGLCSGACLAGFGLGAFFFNFILVAIVNPDNEKQNKDHIFPKEIGENLPFALQILAAVYLSVGIIGVLLINPPKSKAQQSQQQLNPLLGLDQSQNEMDNSSHFSTKAFRYAKSKRIHLLVFILATSVPYGLFVAFNYKQYGSYYINDDHYLSILGSIGSIGNGVFRILLGVLMDYLSFKKIKIMMISVHIISCATIIWSARNKASYLITVLVTYGFYGGLYSIYPTQTVKILGRKIGPKIYYLTFTGFSFGAILQYIAHKYLVDYYHYDGYTYCFIIFGALLVLSAVLILTIEFEMDKSEKFSKDKVGSTLQNDD